MSQAKPRKRFTIGTTFRALMSEKISTLIWLAIFMVGAHYLYEWIHSMYKFYNVETFKELWNLSLALNIPDKQDPDAWAAVVAVGWIVYYAFMYLVPFLLGVNLLVSTWYEMRAKATLDLDNNTITITTFGFIWSKHVDQYTFDRVVECKVRQNILDGIFDSGKVSMTIVRYLNTDESDQTIYLPRLVKPHIKAETWSKLMPWERDIAITLKR
jgi:hypothetical protein